LDGSQVVLGMEADGQHQREEHSESSQKNESGTHGSGHIVAAVRRKLKARARLSIIAAHQIPPGTHEVFTRLHVSFTARSLCEHSQAVIESLHLAYRADPGTVTLLLDQEDDALDAFPYVGFGTVPNGGINSVESGFQVGCSHLLDSPLAGPRINGLPECPRKLNCPHDLLFPNWLTNNIVPPAAYDVLPQAIVVAAGTENYALRPVGIEERLKGFGPVQV
jgi:hypothetical protein